MKFVWLQGAWLFALLVPLVVFYFLKLRRPRQVISSLVLWRQVLSDQRVNSPFQRFKRNLLLLLQLLLLCLLALAAMQPFLNRASAVSGRLPILIDVSASMAAVAGGKSRLDEAKERVRERIESLPPDQELALIAFGQSGRRLTGFTNSKTELLDALNALRAEDTTANLEDGLRMAQALARTAPFESVLVITDGNLPAQSNFDLPFQLDLQKLPPAGANLGIVAMNARHTADGNWEVFVQLGSSAGYPAGTAQLDLDAAGRPLGSESIAIGSEVAPRLSFRLGGESAVLVRAELKPGGPDSLAADNTAWLWLPATRTLDIFVPETMAPFRHALTTVPAVRIFPAKDTPSPSSYDLAFTGADDFEKTKAALLVTTGGIPTTLREVLTAAKNTVGAIDWRRDSPLLQHVSFDEVLFMDDPAYAPGFEPSQLAAAGFDTLVDGPRGPLALARIEPDRGEITSVHMLFQPERSTLPFRVAFPVLVNNLAAHARKLAGLSEAVAAATGVLPPREFAPGVEVEISGPAGSRKERASATGLLTGVPAPFSGEYKLSSSGTEHRIGASLLSNAETSLATVDELAFAESIKITADATTPKTDRSLWWALACIGLAVLMIEWWWFQRRPF